MIRRLFPMVLWLLATVALAQEPSNGPVITWEELSHEFGDIVQGEKIEHTFKFKNTGTAARNH